MRKSGGQGQHQFTRDNPRLSSGTKLRRLRKANGLSSFVQRDNRGRLPHMVSYVLRALLVVVTGENLALGYQPIIVFVAWRISSLFVQLVCTNADLLFQVQCGGVFWNFNGFRRRHDCNLFATCVAIPRGLSASHK
jgi:hypothetical protein